MFIYDGIAFDFAQLPESAPESGRRARRSPSKRRSKAKREVNYHGRIRPATLALHDRIAALLEGCAGLSVREIAAEVGVSRQLCLYHIKKMVAHGRLIAELAPCPINGGVQFVVYEKRMRALELAIWLKETTGLAA